MSSVSPTASSSPSLSAVLSAFNATGATGTSNSVPLSSVSQLQRTLYQQLDQAFKQGSSLSDIGSSIVQQVSTTLQQYGVSDDQRQVVIGNLQQVFAQAQNRSDARQNARQVLDQFLQSLQPSDGTEQALPATDAAMGQSLDLTA
jgi:hypothetical protein